MSGSLSEAVRTLAPHLSDVENAEAVMQAVALMEHGLNAALAVVEGEERDERLDRQALEVLRSVATIGGASDLLLFLNIDVERLERAIEVTRWRVEGE